MGAQGTLMGDYKASGIRRRDTRNTKLPDIRPPSGSKKDTKRWCRGVVGREHEPECRLSKYSFAQEWRDLVCKKCGKELDWWWPSRFWPRAKPKPDWVTF